MAGTGGNTSLAGGLVANATSLDSNGRNHYCQMVHFDDGANAKGIKVKCQKTGSLYSFS